MRKRSVATWVRFRWWRCWRWRRLAWGAGVCSSAGGFGRPGDVRDRHGALGAELPDPAPDRQGGGELHGVGRTLRLDPSDLSGGSVEVTIQTASINTLNEQRDAHLRSPDFFAADSFPTMTYRSNRVEVDGDRIKVYGDLTLRGVTRPVVPGWSVPRQARGGPVGKERVAFLATTTINRQDFGVSYNLGPRDDDDDRRRGRDRDRHRGGEAVTALVVGVEERQTFRRSRHPTPDH